MRTHIKVWLPVVFLLWMGHNFLPHMHEMNQDDAPMHSSLQKQPNASLIFVFSPEHAFTNKIGDWVNTNGSAYCSMGSMQFPSLWGQRLITTDPLLKDPLVLQFLPDLRGPPVC